jgi:hypothetical protein
LSEWSQRSWIRRAMALCKWGRRMWFAAQIMNWLI